MKKIFVRGRVVVGVGLSVVCKPLVGIVSSLVGTAVVCRGSAVVVTELGNTVSSLVGTAVVCRVSALVGPPLGSIVSALVVTAVVGMVSVLVGTAVFGIVSTLVGTGVVCTSGKVDQACKKTHRYYIETNGIKQIRIASRINDDIFDCELTIWRLCAALRAVQRTTISQ